MLKRTIFLLMILPFVLLACSSVEDEMVDSAETTIDTTVDNVDAPEGADNSEEPADTVDNATAETTATEDTAEVEAVATTYVVDTAASTLTWMGAKPVGRSHTGTIDLASGELVVRDNQLLSGQFVIDMATISESERNARLEGHLVSDDFFGVATYPEAMLNILAVEGVSAGMYQVTADLTIKEITNQITFPVEAAIEGNRLTGSADLTFDRSLWDVRYGSGSFFDGLGDELINDEIEMSVEIVANS